jgi:hypothetical protein
LVPLLMSDVTFMVAADVATRKRGGGVWTAHAPHVAHSPLHTSGPP